MLLENNKFMDISPAKKILRIVMVLALVLIVLGFVYLILEITGLWEKLNSVEKLQTVILELGFWGRFVFVLLQFLQVTFIPIPSPILVVAGSLIYGPFQSSLLSLSGILLGSGFAFFIGRILGRKIVSFMVGEKVSQKWERFLNRCKYSFVLMMLLPLFPDDVLCLVAGLTNMTWTFFMTTQFVTRPIGIFLLSYCSSGDIIPFHGWGIVVWIIVGILSIAVIYFSSKYSMQIENFIQNIFKRKQKKSK